MITLLIVAMVRDLRRLNKQLKTNEDELKKMSQLIHGRG